METTKEVPREREQQRTVEQIVRVLVHQIQEQVIVQEIPQVVDYFTSLGRVCCTHVQPSAAGTKLLRQYSHMFVFTKFQRFSLLSCYRNNLLRLSKWFHKSGVTQRTSEQCKVHMTTSSTSTSEQTLKEVETS